MAHGREALILISVSGGTGVLDLINFPYSLTPLAEVKIVYRALASCFSSTARSYPYASRFCVYVKLDRQSGIITTQPWSASACSRYFIHIGPSWRRISVRVGQCVIPLASLKTSYVARHVITVQVFSFPTFFAVYVTCTSRGQKHHSCVQ